MIQIIDRAKASSPIGRWWMDGMNSLFDDNVSTNTCHLIRKTWLWLDLHSIRKRNQQTQRPWLFVRCLNPPSPEHGNLLWIACSQCNGASFFSHRLRNIPHYGLLGFFLLPVAVHRTEPSTGKKKKKKKNRFSRFSLNYSLIYRLTCFFVKQSISVFVSHLPDTKFTALRPRLSSSMAQSAP